MSSDATNQFWYIESFRCFVSTIITQANSSYRIQRLVSINAIFILLIYDFDDDISKNDQGARIPSAVVHKVNLTFALVDSEHRAALASQYKYIQNLLGNRVRLENTESGDRQG